MNGVAKFNVAPRAIIERLEVRRFQSQLFKRRERNDLKTEPSALSNCKSTSEMFPGIYGGATEFGIVSYHRESEVAACAGTGLGDKRTVKGGDRVQTVNGWQVRASVRCGEVIVIPAADRH